MQRNRDCQEVDFIPCPRCRATDLTLVTPNYPSYSAGPTVRVTCLTCCKSTVIKYPAWTLALAMARIKRDRHIYLEGCFHVV